MPDWGVCGENGSLAVHMESADTTAVVNVAVQTTREKALLTSFASPTNTASLAVTPSSLPTSASAGLSTRAKAAATGLVTSVGVLALILPGLLVWYKSRKQRAAMVDRKIQDKLEVETETETEFPGRVWV